MCSEPAEPTQRLFFALWPDAGVRAALAGFAQANIRKQARRVSEANLHITLAFPGSVTAGVRQCLEAAAAGIQARPFELAIDRVGHWPRPRILWAGSSHTPAEVWSLVKALRMALQMCGLQPESRPWQAHVTLARKAGRALPVTEIDPIHWSISDFCLVESVTDPSGPVYRIIRRWPLEG
ncbi:MAG: RNA 2',3'-cyclic phosphodiesterase [Gammaproteobacteria bacterium]|nr:RNA 2',3'-cyclic phosphodiesterase [Gammaproteobacteria bacterium]